MILMASVIIAGVGIGKGAVRGEEKEATSSAVSSSGAVTGSVVSEPAVVMPGLTLEPSPQPSPQSGITLKKVTDLQVKKAKSLKKVTLKWSSVKNADSYIIYRKKGKGSLSVLAKTQKISYTDKKVKAGASYTYAVRARCSSAEGKNITGAMSAKRSIQLKPASVKGLRATSRSGAISLRWKKQKNVTGYRVYMKVFVHIKGVKTKYNRMMDTKSTHYRKGMLVRGMKYGFLVCSYKKVGKKKVSSNFMKVVQKAG